MFFPSGYKEYNKLPENFDPFKKPKGKNVEPSTWLINLAGIIVIQLF